MGASRDVRGLVMAKPTRSAERGPDEMCCSERREAELTWAGLPSHIWKEAKKISVPPPACTYEHEDANPAAGRLMVQECGRMVKGRGEEDNSRSRRGLVFDR